MATNHYIGGYDGGTRLYRTPSSANVSKFQMWMKDED